MVRVPKTTTHNTVQVDVLAMCGWVILCRTLRLGAARFIPTPMENTSHNTSQPPGKPPVCVQLGTTAPPAEAPPRCLTSLSYAPHSARTLHPSHPHSTPPSPRHDSATTAADRPTTYQHWQLRDLVHCGEEPGEVYCTHESQLIKYDTLRNEVRARGTARAQRGSARVRGVGRVRVWTERPGGAGGRSA